MRRAILAGLGVLLFIVPAFGQDPTTGFPPYGSFADGRFDAVNRQNLNVNFAIPIVSSPGRGTDFGFGVVYDSLIWKKVTSGSTTTWSPVTDENGVATWGWKKDFPIGFISYTGTTTTQTIKCFYNWGWEWDTKTTVTRDNYAYTDPAGTPHKFSVSWQQVEACDFPSTPTGTFTGTATDGSGFYIDINAPTSPFVRSSSGIKINHTAGSGTNKLTDTNGNYISKTTVSGTETHWIDALGRITLKVKSPSSTTMEYHVLDKDGNYQVTTLTLQPFNIKTNFACSGVVEYTSTGPVNLPVSILLPNGRSYSFTYEVTPGFSDKVTGRVKRVTLPTGGFYEYQYPATPNNGIICADATVNNLTRVIHDGVSSVTWQFVRPDSFKTVVTAPQLPYDSAANQSTFTFNSSKQLTSQKIYQGSETGGTLLRTINTTWAANGTPSGTTVILEDGSKQSKTETVFDTYGNLTQLKEYDWGIGAPGSIVRTTTLGYETGAAYANLNIRNRVKQQILREGDVTGAIKSRTDIVYDTATALTCVTGAAQHDDTNYGCSFTTRGNPTKTTTYTNAATPSGAVDKFFTYDSLGNLRQGDVNCCQQKQWAFSAATQYAYPDSVTDGPPTGTQLTTSFTYNFNTGLLSSTTDPNNKTTSLSYDTLRRLTAVTRPDNQQITTSYDDTNRIIIVEVPVQGTDRARRRTEYDQLGRPFRQCLLNSGGATVSCTETQYDGLGTPHRESNPFPDTAWYWTETRLDALGRPTLVIPPDGSPTSNRTVHSYAGNAVTVTDPTGKQRKTETDGLGRLAKVYEPDIASGNQLTQLTTNTYNVLGLLTQVSQGVQTRTFNYDDLGRVTSGTTPEAGTVSYQYNSFNLVTQRTDARGVVTTYSYDGLNRLTQVSYSDATPQVNFYYDWAEWPFHTNVIGRLSHMVNGGNWFEFGYDSLGRVTIVARWVDSAGGTVTYAYNHMGEPTSITYPSGRVVNYAYDSVGRLTSVSSGGTTYASGFAYNPAGQVTSFNYGNGVRGVFDYSPERLLLTSLRYTKQDTILLLLSYGYTQNGGNNGQMTSITDAMQSGRTVNYTYDALGRLATALTQGSASYPQWGLSWTYDRYSNRTAQTVTAGTAPSNSLTVNPINNRITGTGFGYDASGNMTQDGLNTYTYEAENRIKTVNGTGATYTYNATGLRIKTVVGSTTTRYIYSGSKVIAEYVNASPPAAPAREYIYAGGQLIATIAGSTTTYHHPDHLSVRVNTDSAGNKVGEQGHYPYGETWYMQNTTTKWQFTTYERDAESTLDYAVFRYDCSRLGRFMTPDPIAGGIGDPQSMNRYAYTRNDPVNFVDPLGLLCVTSVRIWREDYYDIYLDSDTEQPINVPTGSGIFAGVGPTYCTRPLNPREPQDKEQGEEQGEENSICDQIIAQGGGFVQQGTLTYQFDSQGKFVGLKFPVTGPTEAANVGGFMIGPGTSFGAVLNSPNSISFGFSDPVRTSDFFGVFFYVATFSGGQFTEVRGAAAVGPFPLGPKRTPSSLLRALFNRNDDLKRLAELIQSTLGFLNAAVDCYSLFGAN
ncbi:MAG: hypothetical protein L0338_14665 [Acidobacteria bacterium]|nr:hypothetical protein [Acidobacteriota bacterium]